MVQFCPKCGTQAPDDEAVFCNKCGTRLPPVISEKQDIFCQRCGTKTPDDQSAFCNKCGSPLQSISPAQIQVAGIRQAAAASRPIVKKHRCPSCGAPLVDDISDYCNVCGADVRSPAPVPPQRDTPRPAPERMAPAPLTPAPEAPQPSREKIRPEAPAADNPGGSKEVPVQEKSRRPLLKWGLVAIAVVILLAVIAAFVTGMIPGVGQSPDETPAPADTPVTVLPTQKTTHTTTPKMTTAPAKVTTKPPVTGETTNISTNVTVNATATRAMNSSANVTANVTANATTTATPAPTPTFPTQPLSIGQSASDGKGKLTLNSITFKEKMGDPTPSYAIGKKYLIVDITYENLQRNVTTEIDLTKMAVKDAGGYAFDQADDVTLEKPFSVYGKTIPAQENRTGNMLFIVPPEATFLKFSFDFGEQKIAVFQIS